MIGLTIFDRKEGLHHCKDLAKEFDICANLGPALVIAEREYSPASLAISPFRGKLSAPSNTSHTSSANQNTPREFSQSTRRVKAKKIGTSRKNRKKRSLATAMLDDSK
jgi:hypothetical protein